MYRVEHGDWVPGAVLRVYSRRRSVWHFGIADEWGQSGPMVMHASKDHGQFVLTTCAEFSEGQEPQYVQLPDSLEVRQAILQRAESLLGRPYHLLNANCEDYVNWIVTGVARSPQRETAAFIAVLGLIAFGLMKFASTAR